MGLTYAERKKCASIIHGASGTAALVGSGMAQIPLSDAVVIAPVQVGMIVALGSVFDIETTERAAKGLFASLAASCVERATSQVLFGWVPILGNIVNAGTAAALTEAVGWLAVDHFQSERAKRGFQSMAVEYFSSESERIFSTARKKWDRFWRKTKKFCEERLEDLEEQFEG